MTTAKYVNSVEDADEFVREEFRHFAGPYTRREEARLIREVMRRFGLREETAAGVVGEAARPFAHSLEEEERRERADRRSRLKYALGWLAVVLALLIAYAVYWALALHAASTLYRGL